MNPSISWGPMLNAYPDSVGGTLSDIVSFLERPEMKHTFSSFYILPSLFNTDLDRGFSVISYDLNECLASKEDLKRLKDENIDLKLDFILNHASVLSPMFQDILEKGDESEYRDFFIDWNKFWEGHGEMTEEGYIQPDPELIRNMFFRKPGLPILMVRFPDGRNVPYWNTFYQEVRYPRLDAQDVMKAAHLQYYAADKVAALVNEAIASGKKPYEIDYGPFEAAKEAVTELLEKGRKYLGQMDLNIRSEKVWEHYDRTLKQLSEYGASIARLDAFAYAPKAVGERNFLNDPGTWDLLEKVRQLADKYNVTLLPEIHASYGEKTYELVASKGYMVYDFFLPGLLIDALYKGDATVLGRWAKELIDRKIRTVNMLGCHDGIPLLDLKGLLEDERIQELIDTVVGRGGHVKDLHGQKNVYYQVNATYYSALGEDDRAMLLSRAVQMMMPGKPQVWYLDLFDGKNDYEAMRRAGAGGHKEINRTNLSPEDIAEGLKKENVQQQIELLRFRHDFKAFAPDAEMSVCADGAVLELCWKKDGYTAYLKADMKDHGFCLKGTDDKGDVVFEMTQA